MSPLPTHPADFGRWVLLKRTQTGITRQALADAANIRGGDLIRIEREQCLASIPVQKRLITALERFTSQKKGQP